MMRSSGNSAATISGRMWKADHTTMFVTRPHTRDVKLIELRSDTFTLPTPAMRRAMADAEVGDDQYGEDPTVNRLEKRAAEVVGKEAAVYVASGMLGNLCGVLSQTQRGDEVILGDLAHIVQNEMGASFVVGGIVPRLVPNRDGLPSLEDLATATRPQGMYPRTSLVCLENSHNNCGGAVLTAALGVEARDLVRDVDTVQFCFSKGLAAPVGSILCGDAETVAKARRVRKLLGGAMRQAGVIAAAALVGLEEMRDRLVDDHRNAKSPADGLAGIRGIRIDAGKVVTNIVSFEVDPQWMDTGAFQRACAERGLRISRYLGSSPRLRAVTHHGIERADIASALEIVSGVLSRARTPVAAAD